MQFAQVEEAALTERATPLDDLMRMMRALAAAEEDVLFPALRQAVGPEANLADSCMAEHRDLADRLETLARSPHQPGFDTAFAALAQDARDHQRDEIDILVPVLIEARGEEGASELAASFERALGRA